jgi:uncharacterized protein YjbI with pentapeptide repeats
LCTERAVFSECDFSGVNLTESQHRGSAFRNCTFKRTLLWHWGHHPLAGATFAQCSMLGSVFVQCRLRPLTFDEVDFTLAVLGGNDLRGADLSGARTTGARLDADLRGATVDPSLWRTATLAGACVDVAQALAFAVAHGLRLGEAQGR